MQLPPAIAALALLLFFCALRPVGYHGGGWDDWHYLEAARCAAANGLCVPTSHWWSRWPLVAPMAASLWLLGESRAVLWIVPTLYAVAATILFAKLVERQFGRTAALIASIALVASPVFNERALNPNADIPELAWVLTSLLALQTALKSGKAVWAAAAGLFLSLAIATRPTAITLIPIAALALLFASRASARVTAPFLGATVAALAAEAAIYRLWTGDAFLGWQLALSHTTIPSTELARGVDLRESPLFNVGYIDGWSPAAGIEVHWAIDPILNLLAHSATGPTLLPELALLLLVHRELDPERKRMVFMFLAAAALHFGALVYALAIDPKPRMFLIEIASAAAVIGLCAVASAQQRAVGLIVTAGLGLVVATSIGTQLQASDGGLPQLERVAGQWIAGAPSPPATSDTTRKVLTLVPGVQRLPKHDGTGRYSDLLLLGESGCSAMHSSLGAGRWRTSAEFPLAQASSPAAGWLRSRNILPANRETAALCLFSR